MGYTDRLATIDISTLITSGKYDEATPTISQTVNKGIINSKWVLFENSSHLSHLEEPELYLKILAEFLSTFPY